MTYNGRMRAAYFGYKGVVVRRNADGTFQAHPGGAVFEPDPRKLVGAPNDAAARFDTQNAMSIAQAARKRTGNARPVPASKPFMVLRDDGWRLAVEFSDGSFRTSAGRMIPRDSVQCAVMPDMLKGAKRLAKLDVQFNSLAELRETIKLLTVARDSR